MMQRRKMIMKKWENNGGKVWVCVLTNNKEGVIWDRESDCLKKSTRKGVCASDVGKQSFSLQGNVKDYWVEGSWKSADNFSIFNEQSGSHNATCKERLCVWCRWKGVWLRIEKVKVINTEEKVKNKQIICSFTFSTRRVSGRLIKSEGDSSYIQYC